MDVVELVFGQGCLSFFYCLFFVSVWMRSGLFVFVFFEVFFVDMMCGVFGFVL